MGALYEGESLLEPAEEDTGGSDSRCMQPASMGFSEILRTLECCEGGVFLEENST
jgi:hypothetical protein